MCRIVMVFGVLCTIVCGVAAEEPTLFERLLVELYPDCAVTMTSASMGQIKLASETRVFAVEYSGEFSYENDNYVLFLLEMDSTEHTPPSTSDDAGQDRSQKLARGAVLIVCPVNDISEAKLVQLTPEAQESQILSLTNPARIGDFIGDDSLQVSFAIMGKHFEDEGKERITATIQCLYSLPLVEPLARVVKEKVYESEEEFSIEILRGVVFLPRDSLRGTPAQIAIEDRLTGETLRTNLNDDSIELAAESPWRHEGQLSPDLAVKTRTIVFKVVDQNDRPLENVLMEGDILKPQLLSQQTVESEISGQTDANGVFKLTAAGTIILHTRSEGFFDGEIDLRWDEHPEGTVTLKLNPLIERVPMIYGLFVAQWDLSSEAHSVGFAIPEEQDDSEDITLGRVEERESADIWMEIFRVGDETSSQFTSESTWARSLRWKIRITGNRGWGIATGPTWDHRPNQYGGMRLAPEAGYSETIELDGLNDLEGLYLRNGDGDRYGRLIRVQASSRKSFNRSSMVSVSFRYLIQESGVNSRSLYPDVSVVTDVEF